MATQASQPTLGEVAYNEYASIFDWEGMKIFEILDDKNREAWERAARIVSLEHEARLGVDDLIMVAMDSASDSKNKNTGKPAGRFWAIVCTELEKIYAYVRVWTK